MRNDINELLEIAMGLKLSKSDERLLEAIQTVNMRRLNTQELVKKAKAEHYNSVIVVGKATAEKTKDTMKLPINITIVPLGISNGNKQGIPVNEANNIINTALHMPIRANFYNNELKGHSGAENVGTITAVENVNNVITAKGFIWKEKNDALVSYLTAKKEIGSSWEMYYADSEVSNGVEWLKGCIFAGHCLVSNPSYGSLTPVSLA